MGARGWFARLFLGKDAICAGRHPRILGLWERCRESPPFSLGIGSGSYRDLSRLAPGFGSISPQLPAFPRPLNFCPGSRADPSLPVPSCPGIPSFAVCLSAGQRSLGQR